MTVSTDRNVVGATGGDFAFEIGDETTRKLRPVECPTSAAAPSRRTDAPRPRPAVGHRHHRQAGPRARPRVPRPQGRPRPGRPDDHRRPRRHGLVQADAGQAGRRLPQQTYEGKPVLTWWEGRLFVGDGDGVGQIYDQNYGPVATVRTGNGYSYDLHEFTITPRNTALVLAYERFRRGLRPGAARATPDRGQHHPGDRPHDRRSPVRVAQLRQRLAVGVEHPGPERTRLRVGVLPRQLDRPHATATS